MVAIDFKAALGNPTSVDHANIEIQGMRISRTVKMGLFTTNKNAVEMGDYLLSKESYPVAKVRFTANRDVFRLQPGDVFKLVLPKYGIQEMICRIAMIEEEDVETEKIAITAVEESVHATMPITTYTEPVNTRRGRDSGRIAVVTPIRIVEVPYSFDGEKVGVIFLIPTMTGNETGYHLYMSIDGTEYYKLKTGNLLDVYGTLASAYPETSTIDDEIGVTVNFTSSQNTDIMQSIGRVDLYGNRNLAVINNEIMTIQLVIPITATQYKFTGVYRGRWGTVHTSHAINSPFYWVRNRTPLVNGQFMIGSTRYFKLISYSSSQAGALSAAIVNSHTFTGEAYTPYEVINLKANGENYNPLYDSEDIVLTWTPRVRGAGTGLGDPSIVTDAAQTHEGKFRVTIDVGGSTVRTVEDLEVYTYNYTAANIIADNGKYISPITANVTNYIVGAGSIEYESDETSVVIRRLAYSTTTTSTTTTSTTTTTTT